MTARVHQLPQRLGFDLADALTRHVELLAQLLQRAVGVHADAEAGLGLFLCRRIGLAGVTLLHFHAHPIGAHVVTVGPG